jgi:hypothetical protein
VIKGCGRVWVECKKSFLIKQAQTESAHIVRN